MNGFKSMTIEKNLVPGGERSGCTEKGTRLKNAFTDL